MGFGGDYTESEFLVECRSNTQRLLFILFNLYVCLISASQSGLSPNIILRKEGGREREKEFVLLGNDQLCKAHLPWVSSVQRLV